ncbi:MAG: Dihydrolipoamide acetyltransferase component of pyruvate dehydrogenase complex [Gammaproteobacteria bacterium]|nr:Dihydrolipoamide acetyltransferase component of pyruvate dehydrogenase complex [Gammaproteobacteria bacterium]
MTTFNLPDLGEGLAEAEIVRWHVNVGDVVTVDQPMLAVETAKAIVEVPAPYSGIVKTLHGQPGDVIATGAPLVEFDLTQAAAPAHRPATSAPTPASPAQTAAISAPHSGAASDSGTVVGSMPTSDHELIETAHAGGSSAANGAIKLRADERLRAAPAARALAKKLGIDLTGLRGSGRAGVIVVEDVIASSGAGVAAAPGAATSNWGDASAPDAALASAPAAGQAARPSTAFRPSPARLPDTSAPFTGGEKLRGLRRAMAQSMGLARDNVAKCTLFDDGDLHLWRKDEDFTTRLLRAIGTGCKAEPALNAWFDGPSQSRRLLTQVDVGMAVDTTDGLIVPVIRDVGNRTAVELREDIDRLKRTARDRTITPDDLRHVSFMLSNFGMIAGRYATPVVVPPTVAILGSGRLSRDVVAVNEAIEVHLRMPLSLTFDHRCVTGGEAARFLAAVLRDLEKDN